MKKHVENMWDWVKEHKKEIAIAGVASVISVIGGIIVYRKIESAKTFDLHLPALDISPGSDRFHGGGTQIAIYDDVFPLAAMGKLGECIAENIPDLPNNPNVVYAEIVMAK